MELAKKEQRRRKESTEKEEGDTEGIKEEKRKMKYERKKI